MSLDVACSSVVSCRYVLAGDAAEERDGSTVSYLQLAHNERHPDTGASTAKVIHSFGRAQDVDRDALTRLVSSISRFLTPSRLR